ncbi:aminopeptidase P family protein [Egibacter rhizosphaerae]|uniref:Aminopeptidase P family protein n=1 Tax=Egibacter rhizosphaerae TaxID=1670831 RepID=A0A411YKK0_9ACTN|nr:Xaa-Pro peptidase family protein [Egibacter rhizosphaerae]QBI21710.1 aminopeptidase P family protein [Egibacter rhizosphaerae]
MAHVPLDRTAAAMERAGIDALLVGPGADLQYLTGYHALPLERLTLLVARADGAHHLVVPRLEVARAEDAGLPDNLRLAVHDETDDPYALVAGLLDGAGDRLAIGDRLWGMFVLGLQQALPGASWRLASEVTAQLRMRKTAAEVDALRRAGRAIDRVHEACPEILRPGRSEAECAREIADRIVAEGHDDVRFVIVASGPNGASPHHESGDRILAEGDPVVVDIGGSVDGYCSDCTRNYLVGETGEPEGYREAHRVLEDAQRVATEAVRPGVAVGEIDRVARAHLADAGYGDYFIHRTGHGIGLEEHEEPYLVEGRESALEPGMAFSIEPGIYIPDRFGMRIEDIVVVTDDGAEVLNRLDRAPRRTQPAVAARAH